MIAPAGVFGENRPAWPGRLFIVEGIDGSGKSTQLTLLSQWLRAEGYPVVFSEWNSSPIVRETTKQGKKREIVPFLKAGAIVLADRYVYTAFARDVARGVSARWVRSLYRFAVVPALAVYFRTPLEVALKRILSGRPKLKHYEAGMDLGLHPDVQHSYRLFQSRILDEYERIVSEFDLTVMDATRPIETQQRALRKAIRPHLETIRRGEALHGRG